MRMLLSVLPLLDGCYPPHLLSAIPAQQRGPDVPPALHQRLGGDSGAESALQIFIKLRMQSSRSEAQIH